MIEIWFVILCL